MLNADKKFLENMRNFIYQSRAVACSGLYSAGENSLNTAALVLSNIENLSFEEAEKKAKQQNEAARVQSIIIAKMIAEFVGAMEDLSAFCYAVKNRSGKGIFLKYLLSKGEVGQYAKDLVDNIDKEEDLSNILNIPRLEDLKKKVSDSLYKDIEDSYKNLYCVIRTVAEMYRKTNKEENVFKEDGINKDVIYIITDAVSKESRNNNNQGILPRVYNKIKHRFLVFDENFKEFLESIDQDGKISIDYAIYPRNPNAVGNMYNNIMAVSKCQCEIVSLLLLLDKNNIEL